MFEQIKSIFGQIEKHPAPQIRVRDEMGIEQSDVYDEILELYPEAVEYVRKTQRPVDILRNNRVWAIEPATP